MKRNAPIELFWRIHPKLYRWSSGRIGGSLRSLPVLLLTTRGRKTGLLRTKALMYLPYGADFTVFASNLGEPQHPLWWFNLQADPNALVEVGSTQYTVRARDAEGDERERLWRAVMEKAPDYDEYQARTPRRIPVVVLERLQPKIFDYIIWKNPNKCSVKHQCLYTILAKRNNLSFVKRTLSKNLD